jgi:hypothetical protein
MANSLVNGAVGAKHQRFASGKTGRGSAKQLSNLKPSTDRGRRRAEKREKK